MGELPYKVGEHRPHLTVIGGSALQPKQPAVKRPTVSIQLLHAGNYENVKSVHDMPERAETRFKRRLLRNQ